MAFTSLSATSSTGTDQLTPSNYAEAAILDSGTTITLLPNDIAQAVFNELGATVSQELGATVVPCSLSSNTGTLNYGFGGPGGPTIKVAVSQLVLPLTLADGRTPPTATAPPPASSASKPPATSPSSSATPSCAPPTPSTTSITTASRSPRPISTPPAQTSYPLPPGARVSPAPPAPRTRRA